MLVCPHCGLEMDMTEIGEMCTNCGVQVPLDTETRNGPGEGGCVIAGHSHGPARQDIEGKNEPGEGAGGG